MGLFDIFRKPKPAAPPIEEPEQPTFTDVSTDQVDELRQAGATVVDVRTPLEFAGGHIPGALSVPLDTLGRDPAGLLPAGALLFVCEMGGRSAMAAHLATQAGLAPVYNLDGGMSAWREDDRTIEE